MCVLYLKDSHLAQDAVSDTFLKAHLNINKFKGDSSEKTWLTRIAVNCCKNIMRTRSYKNADLELDETHPAPSNAYGMLENSITVSGEIAKLPVKYREVILLFYYREFTVKEIAKILKIPRTTVDYRLRYAKNLLKESLKEDYFDE
jgi:RNA polymerase sigma-70 factor (ECF subfamily)